MPVRPFDPGLHVPSRTYAIRVCLALELQPEHCELKNVVTAN